MDVMYEAQQYGEAYHPELVWSRLGLGAGVGVQHGIWDTPEFRCAGATAGADGFDLDCYQDHHLARSARAASLEAACDAGAAWCTHGPEAVVTPIVGVHRVERDPEAPRPEVLGNWRWYLEERDDPIGDGFRPLLELVVEHPQLCRVYGWTQMFTMSFSRCSGQQGNRGFTSDALGGWAVVGPWPGRPWHFEMPMALARPTPEEVQTQEGRVAHFERSRRIGAELQAGPDLTGSYVLCPPEGPGRVVSAEECAAELATHMRPGGGSAAIPACCPDPPY